MPTQKDRGPAGVNRQGPNPHEEDTPTKKCRSKKYITGNHQGAHRERAITITATLPPGFTCQVVEQ
jgi:hypothetical protein